MTDLQKQAAEVVGRLTKAQKDALLHATCAVPPQIEERSLDCICNSNECSGLQDLGLAEPRWRWPNGIVRTPLGLAVRALLQDNPHARDNEEMSDE